MVYKPDREYRWRGVQYPVPANEAAQYFNELEKKYGAVTVENLLEFARPEDSPMHDCFEWDDTVAAEKWRRRQSSHIICNLVTVTVTKEESKPIVVKPYINVIEGNKRGSYQSFDRAMAVEKTRSIVLGRALKELKSFERKDATLNELADVFTSINDAVERYGEASE